MRVGVDVISVNRFMPLGEGDRHYWRHVFSKREWQRAWGEGNAHLHLAALFALKEACMKATGEVGQEHYRSFEIMHDDAGAPQIVGRDIAVSVSHAEGVAVAIAVTS